MNLASDIGFVASGLVLAAFGITGIDPARRALASERLAIDGGIEAT